MVTQNMLFRQEKNWKKKLAPEDEQKLNEMIELASIHRSAYSIAEEVKSAQLWCALLELKKENVHLKERLGKIEYLLDGFASRAASIELSKKSIIESHEKF